MALSTRFAVAACTVILSVASQLAEGGANSMTTTSTQLYSVEGAILFSSTGTQQEVEDAARGALPELLGADSGYFAVTTAAVEHPWINELHYDNVGIDVAEGFEIAGPAGTDLSNYKVVLYNGNGGAVYATDNLTGVIGDLQEGYGAVWFGRPSNGVQNGAPDGLALATYDEQVIQFLSYEGSFIATDGPASGLTSADIAVSESSLTPAGQSLQLAGNGSRYDDFTWQVPRASTPSAVNAGQAFLAPEAQSSMLQPNEITNETANETANESAEPRRLTSAGRWRLDYAIVADRMSAEGLFEAANSLRSNVSAAATFLQERFASRGLLLEGSSLWVFEPSLQAITATGTTISTTTMSTTVRATAMTAAAAEDESISLPLILGTSAGILVLLSLGALVAFLVLRARRAKASQDKEVTARSGSRTETIQV